MKKIAILQSNYIPWKGYFDIINSVDEFVILDDVQYTRRDWRNRNKIKTKDGIKWLTIPVNVKGRFTQKIDETKVTDRHWANKHWKAICNNYIKAKYFENYRAEFKTAYEFVSELDLLSDINFYFLRLINKILGIHIILCNSENYPVEGNKTDKIGSICKHAGADIYVSGPAAISYINSDFLQKNEISVQWADYSGYPEYNQLFPPFIHSVSIIDLIFNEGPNANRYLKSFE